MIKILSFNFLFFLFQINVVTEKTDIKSLSQLSETDKPNFILIITDNLGYGKIDCQLYQKMQNTSTNPQKIKKWMTCQKLIG